ncbi:hypothetical protein JT06_16095 [Desulfobulbus sp. Tol-SR]|nr:hypothetical protein JT06_16095 [Desulfobulbus sp. Tol-SR]
MVQISQHPKIGGTETMVRTVRQNMSLLHYTFTLPSGESFVTLKHSLETCRDDVIKQIKRAK